VEIVLLLSSDVAIEVVFTVLYTDCKVGAKDIIG
jgi:hypothetical protein